MQTLYNIQRIFLSPSFASIRRSRKSKRGKEDLHEFTAVRDNSENDNNAGMDFNRSYSRYVVENIGARKFQANR